MEHPEVDVQLLHDGLKMAFLILPIINDEVLLEPQVFNILP